MDKPKYLKNKYDIFTFKSYKDIPGWVNDAEFIYEEVVKNAEDGDHFVEIGVLLGQSTTHMAELIKESGKDIKFDAIDIFWIIEETLQNYEQTNHPKQFLDYYNDVKNEWDMNIINIIKHPMRILEVEQYVNLITCDEKYAHKIYKDDSLKFVWIDGDHDADVVYNDLVNFWPKLKVDGVIAGDDIHYKEVLSDVEKFSTEYNVKVQYDYNSFKITKE